MFYCIKTNTFFRSDKDSSANYAFSIPKGLFFADSVVPEIGVRKAELTREAAGLNEEISNLPEYISTTISMSSQLGTWWSEYDFDTCQSIQKLVHPRGIYWDNEKKCYLTIEENEVFGLFRSISSDYVAVTNEKQDKSCDLSCLVAEAGLEPTTSGL